MLSKNNRKKIGKALPQKKRFPSDKEIQKGFERLLLNQWEGIPYTGAGEFARNFKRCTLFEESAITTAAHAGV